MTIVSAQCNAQMSARMQADSAYALLQSGQADQAATLYQNLVDQGYQSADLQLNLGNAYFKDAKLGHALLAYERAHHVRPDDSQILYNLELANYEIEDNYHWEDNRFITTRVADSIGSMMPTNVLLLLAFVFLVFSIVLYGLYRLRRPDIHPKTKLAAKATSILAIVLFVLSWLGHRYDTLDIGAIVLAPQVNVYAAPDSLSESNLIIHAGTKFYGEQNMSDYTRIILPNGPVGWIHDSTFEYIHPQ